MIKCNMIGMDGTSLNALDQLRGDVRITEYYTLSEVESLYYAMRHAGTKYIGMYSEIKPRIDEIEMKLPDETELMKSKFDCANNLLGCRSDDCEVKRKRLLEDAIAQSDKVKQLREERALLMGQLRYALTDYRLSKKAFLHARKIYEVTPIFRRK